MRDVGCQLPPEAGHPYYFRMSEDSCIWHECSSTLVEHVGQKHSVVLVWFRRKLTDLVMCCTQLKHSRVREPETKRVLHSGTGLTTSHLNRARDQRRCSI